MPSYQTTPFKPSPVLAVSGRPTYLFGSLDDRSSPTLGTVISNSASGTTGTLTFQINAGNAPAVGELITVISTANSAGVFNVTNATILTATTNVLTGVCTVTYAISSTTQATTADVGQVEVPRSEVGETFANGASAPCSVAPNNSAPQQGRTITVSVEVTGTPSAGTVDLQGANIDLDSQYETLPPVSGGSTSSAHIFDASLVGSAQGGEASFADYTMNYRFYRIIVAAVSGGTTPKIVAKLEN